MQSKKCNSQSAIGTPKKLVVSAVIPNSLFNHTFFFIYITLGRMPQSLISRESETD